jgi:hypothetical protein
MSPAAALDEAFWRVEATLREIPDRIKLNQSSRLHCFGSATTPGNDYHGVIA